MKQPHLDIFGAQLFALGIGEVAQLKKEWA